MSCVKTVEIAKLNDLLRTTFTGGRVMATRGLLGLPADEKDKIFAAVRSFNQFGPDNDPHGEHDFGAFDHAGNRIYWKIDYYDRALTHGSEDPSDPKQTTRVLTIMLAEEY